MLHIGSKEQAALPRWAFAGVGTADLEGGWSARQVICGERHAGQVENGVNHSILVYWAAHTPDRQM